MHTTRFAPSPTGELHLGHAFAALVAFEAAAPGRFLLRIEDLDRARSREQYVHSIEADLAWLGLQWPRPVLYQSMRTAAYQQALARLSARGLIYPCFCSRRDIQVEIERAAEAPHPAAPGPDGATLRYPGTCRVLNAQERERRLALGMPHVLRLDVARAAAQVGPLDFFEEGAGPHGERGRMQVQPAQFGDIVLARRDLPAAYHLAVVVDDAHQGVTLVTRGHDLFAATHVQRLLQALLALPAPDYAHHRLILDPQGRKFSKRDRGVTLRALRDEGVTVEQLRHRLGWPV